MSVEPLRLAEGPTAIAHMRAILSVIETGVVQNGPVPGLTIMADPAIQPNAGLGATVSAAERSAHPILH